MRSIKMVWTNVWKVWQRGRRNSRWKRGYTKANRCIKGTYLFSHNMVQKQLFVHSISIEIVNKWYRILLKQFFILLKGTTTKLSFTRCCVPPMRQLQKQGKNGLHRLVLHLFNNDFSFRYFTITRVYLRINKIILSNF